MVQGTVDSRLPTPVDLARVLRAGVRTPESLGVTGPIRKEVKRRLEEISGGTAAITSGEPPRTGGSNVQFLDHADVGSEGLRPVMRMNQWVIWWGVCSWGEEAQAEQVWNAVRDIGLVEPGWSVERGSGGPDMPRAAWGTGGYVRVFKRLTVQQVEQLETLEGLVSRIASDLWWWHQRLEQVKSLALFIA